jgi:hypothetical protein
MILLSILIEAMSRKVKNMNNNFSPLGYLSLIEEIKGHGYKYIAMSDAFKFNERTIILRHDVDFSLEYALQMAHIEYRAGVCSTYFVMLTSEYYNLFDPLNRKILSEISAMGHEIGLHWDSKFLPPDTEVHADFFRAQILMLSSITGKKVRSASQHIPSDTPSFDIDPFIEINAYSKNINNIFRYVSDSSMVWREHTPLDLIKSGECIQFLSHPIWWMSVGSSQKEKLHFFSKSLCKQSKKITNEYLIYLQTHLINRDKHDDYFRNTQKLTSK